MKIILAGLAACLGLAVGGAQAQTVTLQGLGGIQTKTLTVAEFDALPHVTLKLEQRGKTREYEGFSLLELMRQVGGPWGDTLTGKQMNQVLLVSCKDGYTTPAAPRIAAAPSVHKGLSRVRHITAAAMALRVEPRQSASAPLASK